MAYLDLAAEMPTYPLNSAAQKWSAYSSTTPWPGNAAAEGAGYVVVANISNWWGSLHGTTRSPR